MKDNILILFVFVPMLAQSQLYPNNDNTTAGRLLISGYTSSADYDDITITRNKADAGIKVFNSNTAGRSVLLFGHDYGGKYGFLAHQSPSFTAGSGYTQTYKASSTVLVGSDISGLGIISSSDIRFNAGGDDDAKIRMVIKSTGNLGIGTSDPGAQLHLASDDNHEIKISRANGFYGFRIFRNAQSGNVYFQNTDDNNVWGTRIAMAEGGSAWQNLILNPEGGNVSIGTTDPKGYKLAVAGKAIAEEVVVKLETSWPDYVFEDDYRLPTLKELAEYVKQHKHLPEVPTAADVTENGLSLGEMNAILLKKVEELTLHLIRQQQEINELKLKVYEGN